MKSLSYIDRCKHFGYFQIVINVTLVVIVNDNKGIKKHLLSQLESLQH